MLSIYILDNDKILLFALEMWLTKNEYSVRTFFYSEDLLRAVSISTPDFILLDVKLAEEEDGKSVCTKLKQQYAYPYKIYLFSATHVSPEDVEKCGADGFIDKPFDIIYIVDVIDKAIAEN